VDKVHLTSCDYETKLCDALKEKDFLNNGAVIRFSRSVLLTMINIKALHLLTHSDQKRFTWQTVIVQQTNA
jgi:hypothetical protein